MGRKLCPVIDAFQPTLDRIFFYTRHSPAHEQVMAQRASMPVVCAVIENAAGEVLVAQRPAHKHLALKWEFPGGKVEPNELPADALIREIREELGCEIVVVRALPRFVHDYGPVVIEMMPYVCALAPASAAPHAHEHVAIRWVQPETLRTMDLAAADWPVVDAYVK